MTVPSGIVGIVVNPWAGKDVRRLHAPVGASPDTVKVDIVRRAIDAAVAHGATAVLLAADAGRIAPRALVGLKRSRVELIEGPGTGSRLDTRRAATTFAERGCGAVIVLGGDGTCRDVALGWPDVTMIPISTGTNNVFPQMLDGTTAGTAAALVATGAITPDSVRARSKRLLVEFTAPDGTSIVDEALVEVALIDAAFTGARAVTDARDVREVVAALADPASTGLSSIAGRVLPLDRRAPGGVYVRLSADSDGAARTVRAPLVPGTFHTVRIAEARRVAFGEPIELHGPGVLAYDGERDRVLAAGTIATVVVRDDGPHVVDVDHTLMLAADRRCFDLSREGDHGD